jgi:hypothetical protein
VDLVSQEAGGCGFADAWDDAHVQQLGDAALEPDPFEMR